MRIMDERSSIFQDRKQRRAGIEGKLKVKLDLLL